MITYFFINYMAIFIDKLSSSKLQITEIGYKLYIQNLYDDQEQQYIISIGKVQFICERNTLGIIECDITNLPQVKYLVRQSYSIIVNSQSFYYKFHLISNPIFIKKLKTLHLDSAYQKQCKNTCKLMVQNQVFDIDSLINNQKLLQQIKKQQHITIQRNDGLLLYQGNQYIVFTNQQFTLPSLIILAIIIATVTIKYKYYKMYEPYNADDNFLININKDLVHRQECLSEFQSVLEQSKQLLYQQNSE
uniref:Transmembrane protein n=1 Tax=Spironucleus salmonicida TaxID=348837 RepID=V6LUU9_9EUKA|eukprot:EST47481.1 Hypothetical protein SS50377_fx054 [Spironucleus salmonicida]